MKFLRYVCIVIAFYFMLSGCFPRSSTMRGNDGKKYKTVRIGRQVWMAENLKETKYRNGDPIPNVQDKTRWMNIQAGARCAYENDAKNAETCGYLYNWHALNDIRNIAPEGWRVPTDEDWKKLEMRLGMKRADAVKTDMRGAPVGGRLKRTGTRYWKKPNEGATNKSRFSALPGGGRGLDGDFYFIDEAAGFWTADECGSGENLAWYRGLSYQSAEVSRRRYNKQYGFSVRLIRE